MRLRIVGEDEIDRGTFFHAQILHSRYMLKLRMKFLHKDFLQQHWKNTWFVENKSLTATRQTYTRQRVQISSF